MAEPIDKDTARVLLDVGHGIGVLSARAMLRSHQVFESSSLPSSVQELADAYRAGGMPMIAEALEEFVRDEYGRARPAIEGTASPAAVPQGEQKP